MDMIEDVVNDTAAVNFRFSFKQKSGRHIIRLENVSKSYGDLTIFRNSTAHIERGDKIALIGANGKGKSTLLRIISGSESVEGLREEGYNVIKGFYAQHQLEALNVSNEILEELKQSGLDKTELELRQLLGCFLFSDDDVFKKIKVLSGGEKSRVALAKTLISEANFLLLDEPTNHLDFISENILIQALQQYQGTCIVVSHNRHFVSQVANKIWYIEDAEIKEYPGTYDEYIYWKNSLIPLKESEKPTSGVKVKEKRPKPEKPKTDAELKKAENELSALEARIDELQLRIKRQEDHLADPKVYGDADQLLIANTEYETLKEQLEGLNGQWEELFTQIERLQS